MISTRRMILLMAVFIMFLPVLSLAGTVNLPRTGQTTTYALDDDGDIQAGVPWPTPRFKDNGDGTVTDNLTGLMWLKDAFCLSFRGKKLWPDAFRTVVDFNLNSINYACLDYSAIYTDWRLPNINELESLLNAGQANLTEWLHSQGFIDVQAFIYWSSSFNANEVGYAWAIDFRDGSMRSSEINPRDKQERGFDVWLVRAGQQGNIDPNYPANIWKTGQKQSYFLGDDGEKQVGVAWPSPRFIGNNDETVTDNLTGLMWLKDANCFGRRRWQESLKIIADFNANPRSLRCREYQQDYNDWSPKPRRASKLNRFLSVWTCSSHKSPVYKCAE